MTKVLLLSKGWTFEVTTWENDGDNYNTKRYTVNTEEEARAVLDLLELFKNDDDVNNLYEPVDEELGYLAVVFFEWARRHPTFFSTISKKPVEEFNEEQIVDLVVSGIGYKMSLSGNSDFYTRVVESYKIFHAEEDIFVEEVSDQFKTA
jgi:hypothetical protein